MILKIKLSLLILSFSINLLHEFVPHSHVDYSQTALGISKNSAEDSFLASIEKIISFNLGTNHLEHYNQPEKHFNIGFTHDCLLISICPDFRNFNDSSSLLITSSDWIFNSQEYWNEIIARGPPSFLS